MPAKETPMRTVLLALLAAPLLSACAPKKTVAVEDIPKITKLDDLMAVQSTYADPQFKKIGALTYGDADYADFADTAARLKATSAKLKDFSKGAGFDALAARLGEKAAALETAAQAKDANASSTALKEMKATCKECHKQFR
jgi:cytochrome c556